MFAALIYTEVLRRDLPELVWLWLENLLAFHIMKQIISFEPRGKGKERKEIKGK